MTHKTSIQMPCPAGVLFSVRRGFDGWSPSPVDTQRLPAPLGVGPDDTPTATHRKTARPGTTMPYPTPHMAPLLPEMSLTRIADDGDMVGLRTWSEACRLLDDDDRAAVWDEVAAAQTRQREFARRLWMAARRDPDRHDITRTELGEFL